MDAIRQLLDVFLHVNEHLERLVTAWGPWTYVVLFAIIFCETGLVVTPFLPGDSLLFAAGTMAALYPEHVGIGTLLALLTVAAILGDTANYAIGRWLGPRAFTIDRWFLKHEHLERGGRGADALPDVPLLQRRRRDRLGGDLHAGGVFLRRHRGGEEALRARGGGHRGGVGAAAGVGMVGRPPPRRPEGWLNARDVPRIEE